MGDDAMYSVWLVLWCNWLEFENDEWMDFYVGFPVGCLVGGDEMVE